MSAAHWTARLRIHPTAFLAPGAVVLGDVELGARSSVWFNTVIRGDTDRIVIGPDSNLQDNSVVHVDAGSPAIVGARVTVGHRTIVHGCRIEDDCLIGMGSVILSGARIGAGSLIGAASLVREGQEIPPGSLAFGSPAKVMGQVGESHAQAIANGASHYAELARSYLERGLATPHPAERADAGRTGRERGPMTWVEWNQLIDALAATPAWARALARRVGSTRWSARPGPERWSAAEATAHLAAGDAKVFGPRLGLLLRESQPELRSVALEADREPGFRDPDESLSAWEEHRRGLVSQLAPLGPRDWERLGWHEIQGPYRIADMIRIWVEHDLSHRRQIRAALGEWD